MYPMVKTAEPGLSKFIWGNEGMERVPTQTE